jgi:predicted phage terminase large subunit-like protein
MMAVKNLTRARLNVFLRNDLYSSIRRCFQQLNPQTRFVPGWYLEIVAAALESCSRGETRRQIINIPPRYGKSTAASVALIAWHLGRYPAAQIICVSYAQDFAEKLARECRNVMSSAWYQDVFKTRLSTQKQSAQEFVTTAQGFRLATSVGGVLTGRGADLIVIDDALKPAEALSDAQRKAVNEWYDNSLFSRLNDKQNGCIILIMQRLHENDLVGHVLERGDWKVLSLPAIAEQDEHHEIRTVLGRRTFRRDVGDVLHPARETRETLDDIRQTIGEYNFASQYQQAPAPLGGGLVKADWFKYYGPNELPERFDRIVQSWDTANKVNQLSDYSVCTTWGVTRDRLYLLHVFRRRLEFPDLKRTVRDQWRAHRATIVLIEDRASGTQLIQELVREGLSAVKACKSEHDKIMRLNAQTPKIENGFVYLPREAAWLADYLHELTTFPYGKHDDQADSTSQALAWIAQASGEPGHLGAIRRSLAVQYSQRGLALSEIAEIVKTTPDEVRVWLDEHAALLARMGDPSAARPEIEGACVKCGKDLPFNKEYVNRGDEKYCSLDCLRQAGF